MKGISAIVATYKRKDELARLFDSIIASKVPLIELIIVDQNTDGLIDDLIHKYQSLLDIQHIKLTEANQSKARNTGASKAQYDIICFPDDDCWFEPDALTHIHDYFLENPATDLLIINWKQNPRVVNKSFKISKKEMFSFRSVGYVTYVLFFRKKVFLNVGGFMEKIGIGQYIGGGEDSELAFRTITANYNLYFNSSIFVNHKYISIYNRDIQVLRARQRAMGLMYALYDVPALIIIRGLASPLIKLLFAFNLKKIKQHFNLFSGRLEGYNYGKKNKKELMSSTHAIK